MKILVISDYRGYHTTRPEANIFKGLARMGVNVHVMTFADAECVSEFEEAGVKVIPFHPVKKLNRQEIATIRQYIIENDIDLVHLFNSRSIINGVQATMGLPVKVVLYRGYSGGIHWYDPQAYLKFLSPRVDKIMCNSLGVEECIQHQSLFHNFKTVTINKGHEVSWYSETEAHDIKSELGLDPNTFLLVNVANNRKMKGIPYLLKAMAQLPKSANVHLLLIGNGMDNQENLKIIKDAGLENQVHLLGFRKDVLNIVAASDVFVLSSIKGESITKSVIEAMSLKVAPVISDIAGNFELVEHNRSGLVFPSKNTEALADAIMKLYGDRDLCKQIGVNAQQHIADKLNAQQTIDKMYDMYKELLTEESASKEKVVFRMPGEWSQTKIAFS